jgi:hypothetical protein
VHAEVLAVGACARCGSFGCAQCLPSPVCIACQKRAHLAHEPTEIARLRRGTKGSLFFGALLSMLIVGAAVADDESPVTREGLVAGVLVSVLLTACAGVYAFTSRRRVAQLAIGLEVIGALLATLLLSSELGASFLFANAVFDVVRLSRWRD